MMMMTTSATVTEWLTDCLTHCLTDRQTRHEDECFITNYVDKMCCYIYLRPSILLQ